jgi:hypothetical protein
MTHRYPGNQHQPDETTFDHIIPVMWGGETDVDNLQILCWTCNRWKSIMALDYRHHYYSRTIREEADAEHERIDREAWQKICDAYAGADPDTMTRHLVQSLGPGHIVHVTA